MTSLLRRLLHALEVLRSHHRRRLPFVTLAAAFVTGLSGFAFGMVAAAIWVYALPPPQASALIAAFLLRHRPSASFAAVMIGMVAGSPVVHQGTLALYLTALIPFTPGLSVTRIGEHSAPDDPSD